MNIDYRSVIDLLPFKIMVLESTDNGKDFLVIDINATVEITEQLAKADVIGFSFNDLFPHLATTTFLKALQYVYSTKKSIALEPSLYENNDTRRWTKNTIYSISESRLIVISEDYTYHQEAEDLLLRKTELYKKLLDELSEQTKTLAHYKGTIDKYALVLMTDENGIITDISQEYEHISGYTKAELIGQQKSILYHPDMNQEFYDVIMNTLETTGEWTGELIKRRKNGSEYWLLSHIIREKDLKGKTTGYSLIAHDITSKKKLEALSNELEQRIAEEIEKNRLQTVQIMQQSRLAQMGEMLSMIAHQWRQPLASISAIASTLGIDVMMDNYQQDFFQERLESISDLSHHLSKTIDDFRGFFKEDKQKSIFFFKDVVEQSLQILGPTFKNHEINVITQYQDTHQILSYPNELKQAILNILKNAEDALLENHIENKTIHIHCYESNGYGHVKIEDNAGGIPNDILDKIFEPYFSTKLQKDGTGLGLYMSKTIIDDHCGGSLSCRNTTQGACFTISIPIDSKN